MDSCAHLFCFECVRQWAEKENTCPLCKQRFHYLQRVDVGVKFVVNFFCRSALLFSSSARRHSVTNALSSVYSCRIRAVPFQNRGGCEFRSAIRRVTQTFRYDFLKFFELLEPCGIHSAPLSLL